MSDSNARARHLVYLLPSLHICACLATAAMNTDWKYVGLADYPASIAAVGLAWHFNWPPLLLFGIIGTLWWYLIGNIVLFLYRRLVHR